MQSLDPEPSPTRVRPARPEDLEVVSGILQEAAQWLRDKGEPLWQAGELEPEVLRADVEAGLFHLVSIDYEPAGVCKLELEDPLFWPHAAEGQAVYLHRLAVRRKFAGQGISGVIVDFAKRRAFQLGREFVRLDCEEHRPKLRAVYERLGFLERGIRQVGPYRVALYELRVQ